MRRHHLAGVGIGPFNLSLAALAAGIDGLDAVFFDARPEFRWHPGLLVEGATLQVPFLADLVTLVDPASRWSFLNWLKDTTRTHDAYTAADLARLLELKQAYDPDNRFGVGHQLVSSTAPFELAA